MTTATASSTTTTAVTPANLDHRGTVSNTVYTAGFYSDDWDFSVRAILGKSSRGGSDVGEVLATIATVEPGDHEGWFDAWVALGRRVAAIAATSTERGHRVSAARAYLRSANYFAVAVNSIDSLNDTDALLATFAEHRAAWEGFVANTGWSVQRMDIGYEGSSMPGWLFRPDDSGIARPTLVMNNGSDGSLAGCWCEGSQGALERGYNVLMFDGPGQQSMLFERDIPFRPDWERVITPIVDLLIARPDVDATRLALYGVSQAGYWVTRSVAFEHRFAAAIADGGVVEVGRSWLVNFPPEMLDLYRTDPTTFDATMTAAMTTPEARKIKATWDFRARPYGVEGYSAVLDALAAYNVTSVAGQISTPLFIIDPDGEQFFTDQPAELAALVPGAKHARFTEAEGARGHCQPTARELTEQRMFDWLDEQLG